MPEERNLKKIKLIIGLGNPGVRYKKSYHNVGILFVEYLRQSNKLHTILAINSDSYMNESGQFVNEALKEMGVEPHELLVAHDDSDIELGNYKLSFGRGTAGHKGINSIVQAISTKEFSRARIGVRKPTEARKAEAFILTPIPKKEVGLLHEVFEDIIRTLEQT